MRCKEIENAPEGYGLSDDGDLTLLSCKKENCKNCKKNYKICMDKSGISSIITNFGNNIFKAENYKGPPEDLISSLALVTGLDDGGSIATSSQNLKLIEKLKYINLNFGNKTDVYDKNKIKNIRNEIIKNTKYSRKKLDKLGTKFYPNTLDIVKLFLYLLSTILKIFIYCFVMMMGRKIANKRMANIIYWQRKIHFSLYNSCYASLTFLSVRVTQLDLKKNPSFMKSIYYYIMMSYMMILVYDTWGILKIIMIKKKKNLKNDININNKNDDTAEKSIISRRKTINPKKLIIDKTETLRLIKNSSLAVEIFLCTDFKEEKLNDKLFSIFKYYKFLHFFRIILFNISIVTLQNMPFFNLFLLLVYELATLLYISYFQTRSGSLKLKIFLYRLWSHISMMIALIFAIYLATKEKIEKEEQNFFYYILIIMTVIENIFLFSNLSLIPISLVKRFACKNKKKEKKGDVKKEEIIEGQGIYVMKEINTKKPSRINRGLKEVARDIIQMNDRDRLESVKFRTLKKMNSKINNKGKSVESHSINSILPMNRENQNKLYKFRDKEEPDRHLGEEDMDFKRKMSSSPETFQKISRKRNIITKQNKNHELDSNLNSIKRKNKFLEGTSNILIGEIYEKNFELKPQKDFEQIEVEDISESDMKFSSPKRKIIRDTKSQGNYFYHS